MQGRLGDVGPKFLAVRDEKGQVVVFIVVRRLFLIIERDQQRLLTVNCCQSLCGLRILH